MGVLSISSNGVDVRSAKNSQLVFSDKYPFHKLDKTNSVSFQNIRLYFNNDTPNPSGIGADIYNRTLVYQFKHGYSYIPATWLELFVISGLYVNFFYQEYGVIALTRNFPYCAAELHYTVDATNVNIYIDKFYDLSGGATTVPTVASISLLIRFYVFVEDLSGV